MLKGRNLSNEYWVEAVACAIYVINGSPTKIVMKRVPEQAWSGMYYSVSHLREQSKGYKLYNPISKKTIIRRDVVFKEQESWNGTIDKTVDAQVPLMEEYDVAEKEQQASQVKTPNRDTPIRTPRFLEQHGSSRRSKDQDSPSNQSAIEKNDTWDLVDLPKDKNLIGVKWVYKTMLNEKGEIDRFKARLVAKGLSQQPGIDFGETFVSATRLDTVREVLDIAAHNKWKVYQMDVKSAFLNGIIEEEIYMQ
eukprot:PITA_32815